MTWETNLNPAELRALEALRAARQIRKSELREIGRDIATLRDRAYRRARKHPAPPSITKETGA